MANKSIVQKMKGLFMGKNTEKKADTGFEVLNDAPASDIDENEGVLDELGAIEEETTDEAPVESDSIPENEEETEVKAAPKAEKAHEKVARIAAEKNTKGYGL